MCPYVETCLHVHCILCIATLKKNRVIEHEDEALWATVEEFGEQSSKKYANSSTKSNTKHVLNVHPYQLWTIYNAYAYLVVVMFNVHMFESEKVGQVTWAWVVNHHKHQHNDKAKGKDSYIMLLLCLGNKYHQLFIHLCHGKYVDFIYNTCF